MKGAKLIFLPPYSPELNPIETCFSLLKARLKNDLFHAFRHSPVDTIRAAMKLCTGGQQNCIRNLYNHSGYVKGGLVREIILNINDDEENLLS
jgi:transposase